MRKKIGIITFIHALIVRDRLLKKLREEQQERFLAMEEANGNKAKIPIDNIN